MASVIDSYVLQEIVNMGIPHEQAVKALMIYKTKESALAYLFPSPQKQVRSPESADDLALAIQNSLKEVESDYAFYDVYNPETMLRSQNTPVGLKNIGNTCYFNSLIQNYFMIPKFIKEILNFKPQLRRDPNEAQVKSASIQLIQELQLLFSSMILGNKRFIDPSSVLDALVDDSGNKIQIGEQKDVGEFNMNMIARIEEGLQSAQNMQLKLEVRELVSEDQEFLLGGKVSQLFYATQHELLTTQESDGRTLVFENTAIFGQLSLDVNEKELYRAWDHAYHTLIEGYITPNGHNTYAVQEIWPEKLPGILLFQIQRVRYDLTSGRNIKVNTPFTFPLVIYGDRFLLKNKPIYLSVRDRVLSIKSEISRLETELITLENYKDSNIGIVSILSHVSTFLDTQQYSIINPNKSSINPNLLKIPEERITSAQEILDTYKNQLEAHRNRIKHEMDELEIELEKIYNIPELKEYEYALHSILIHEGRAESGHYYAYIFDSEKMVWRKYSDTLIKEISVEEVMKNAIGGNGDSSAYCLIYIHKSFMENKGILRGSVPEDENIDRLGKYATYIQGNIRIKVQEENENFLEEIQEFKAKKITEKIKSLYDDRFSLLVAWSAESRHPEKKNDLINFPMFLRIGKNEPLSRWALLSICTKEITGSSLEELKKNYVQYNSINSILCKYAFGPKSLELSENEKRSISDQFAKFQLKYFHARIGIYIMQCLIKEEFLLGFQALMYQVERITDVNDEMQNMALESRKSIALRLSSTINGCVYEKDIPQALVWARHLAFITTTIGMDDTFFVTLIKNRLLKSIGYIKKYTPNYYNIDVKEEFDEILKTIESMAPVPSYDIENISDELREILQEDTRLREWISHDYSIAWDYCKVFRNYHDSFFFNWVWLVKKNQEKRGNYELEIKEIERDNGIVEKQPW